MKSKHSKVDRSLFALALPLLATLVVEPLLMATDSAFVGNVSATALAGLTVASTILGTIVGLCIFLSFATTASVARAHGAGDDKRAYSVGVEGMWFGCGLGVILAIGLWLSAPTIVGWFDPGAAVAQQAVSYLHWSAWGLPGMLTVLASAGALRGMSDTKTPFYATVVAAIINVILCPLTVFTLHMGIAGAGMSTAIAQTFMATWLGGKILRTALANNATIKPSTQGIVRQSVDAWPLLIRSISLNVALVLQVAVATPLGEESLAAYQLVATLWFFASFVLDALAGAAMILIGQALGRQRLDGVESARAEARAVLNRCLMWGVIGGVGVGLILAAVMPFVVPHMTDSPEVARQAVHAMWLICATFPLMALTFMLDGVLLGASDTRILAILMPLSVLAMLPGCALIYAINADGGRLASWAHNIGFAGSPLATGGAGLLWLWANYALLHVGTRATTTYVRSRSDVIFSR